MNKYRNIPSGQYASRKEARRARELWLLQKAGKIFDLMEQVPFELIPAQYESHPRYSKSGKRLKDGRRLLERPVVYIADFAYQDKEGNTIVEDTKGVRTKEYIIKRKLMLYKHGIRIREI